MVLDAGALLGGLLGELVGGGSSPARFQGHFFDFVRPNDLAPATLKTAAFGLIVALIGCDAGCQAGRSTEEIGRAATTGVVRSMVAVFAVNVVLTLLIRAARF